MNVVVFIMKMIIPTLLKKRYFIPDIDKTCKLIFMHICDTFLSIMYIQVESEIE